MKEECDPYNQFDDTVDPVDESISENGLYINPFSSNFSLDETNRSLENDFQGDENSVQAINTTGKQKTTFIYYDGYRFTKDSTRFSKGLQVEQIYWRCSSAKSVR